MSTISPLVAALSVNPLFSGLGTDTCKRIADLCVTQNLTDGQTLFLKGDPGNALYGVRRGRILITTSTSAGKQLTLNVLGSGDIFGEVALLDGRPRTADAIASGGTELFMIRRGDFQNLLQRQPAIALKIIELLCERVRWTSERMEEASLLALPPRLARRLLKLADDFGEEILISQEELSVLVGAARETVNRQLQQWQRAGLIELGRARIQVLDLRGLQTEAASKD
jgi:CRP/FNR family transcriptional regulator, cyclic AMP receptor protein